jgi:hypothetical protein
LYPITGKNDDNRRKKNEQARFAVESRTAESVPVSGEASRGNSGSGKHGISNWYHDGLRSDMASSDWRGVGLSIGIVFLYAKGIMDVIV